MNNKYLVSVIIPAYNHEKYVQETIESIINQTYRYIELIILDDGSQDSTWQKITEIQGKCEGRFVRVHFATKKNEGVCVTLNKLFALAQGEYVYMIASDDLAKPNAIEEEVAFLDTHQDYALVVGDDEFIDGNGTVAYWDKKRNLVYDKNEAVFLTFKSFLEQISRVNFSSDEFGSYSSLYMGNYIPNGFLVRKSIISFFGGCNLNAPLEDWYLLMQIAKYGKMKYIDKILYSYRWHDSNNVKNQKQMDKNAFLTREFEEKVLNTVDETKVLQDVLVIKKQGCCYKKHGIPSVIEFLKIRKGNKEYKQVRVFSVPVITF